MEVIVYICCTPQSSICAAHHNPFRWSRVNDRLCHMQTGAVFTAKYTCQRLCHVLACAQFSRPTNTCQRLCHMLAYAQFSRPKYTWQRLAVTCLLRRIVNGQIILHCCFLLHRRSSSLLIHYFGFSLFPLFCMF